MPRPANDGCAFEVSTLRNCPRSAGGAFAHEAGTRTERSVASVSIVWMVRARRFLASVALVPLTHLTSSPDHSLNWCCLPPLNELLIPERLAVCGFITAV
jgi:hypothetical protein